MKRLISQLNLALDVYSAHVIDSIYFRKFARTCFQKETHFRHEFELVSFFSGSGRAQRATRLKIVTGRVKLGDCQI